MTLRKLPLPVLVIFYALTGYTQVLNTAWVRGTSCSITYGLSITSDAAGNVIVAGVVQAFGLPVSFDGLAATGPTKAHDYDYFITKYDSSGTPQWSLTCGTKNYDFGGIQVQADSMGFIKILGAFAGDTFRLANSILVDTTGEVVPYMAMINPGGGLEWIRKMPGHATSGRLIGLPDGRFFIISRIKDSVIQFASTTIANRGGYDLLVARYSASAGEEKAFSIAGPGNETFYSACVSKQGNLFMLGTFEGATCQIGSLSFNRLAGQLTSYFIIKVDLQGNPAWVKVPAVDQLHLSAISADHDEFIGITGGMKGHFAKYGSVTLTSKDTFADVFIGRLNRNADPIWMRTAGGNGYDGAQFIASGQAGDLAITGITKSSGMDFGTLSFPVDHPNGERVFLAMYDSAGSEKWAKGLVQKNGYPMGRCVDNPAEIIFDNTDHILTTGYMQTANIDFGTVTLYNCISNTVYVAKINRDISTGLQEDMIGPDVQLFPNPASAMLHVDLPPTADLNLEIRSLSGAVLLSASGTNQIMVQEITEGLYVVKVSSNAGTITRKLLITR